MMKISKNRFLAFGILSLPVLWWWFSVPYGHEKPIVTPSVETGVRKNEDSLLAKHLDQVTPVRAADPAPAFPDILGSGNFSSSDSEFKSSGAVLLLRDQSGKYFLRFEDFSLPAIDDLRLFFFEGEQEKEGSFVSNISAHRGDMNIALPDNFDSSKWKFIKISWSDFDRVVAEAELF